MARGSARSTSELHMVGGRIHDPRNGATSPRSAWSQGPGDPADHGRTRMARAAISGRAPSQERGRLSPPVVAHAHHLPHLRPADPPTRRTSADPGNATSPAGILSPGIGGADRMAVLPNSAQPDADGSTSRTGSGQVAVATTPRAERGRIGSSDSGQNLRRGPERLSSGLAREKD